MSNVVECTLADLIGFVENDPDLTPTRRRDAISALRSTARLIDRQPGDVRADASTLRHHFGRVHHRQAGISAKRLANIKSELAAVLKLYRPRCARTRTKTPLSPAWTALKDSIDVDYQSWRLARLMQFCSDNGIEPDQVDDDTLIGFRAALAEQSLAKDPAKVHKQSIQTWNRLAQSQPDWPSTQLTAPRSEMYWARPITDFPISFQDDVSHWLKRQTDVDLLAADGPKRRLRPTTLNNIRHAIRYFATGLVEQGHAIDQITSLAYLTELDHFKDGLRFFLARNDGERPTWLQGMAGKIVAIAKYHVRADPSEIETLKNITKKMGVRNPGLTEKNRQRLRQFDDPRNVWLLVNLPQRLVEKANKHANPSSWVALDVQIAVAIEILLMAPMRIANLAGVDLSRHLTWQGSGRRRVVKLAIPGGEVKNAQPIECTLPQESSALLDIYLNRYRPHLLAGPSDWLFPSRSGAQQKRTRHLGNQISEKVLKETGLEVNPHLFRHLGALFYLTDKPGGYEVVRRVLGHRSSDTTLAFYTGFETKSAVEHFDETILKHRRRLPGRTDARG